MHNKVEPCLDKHHKLPVLEQIHVNTISVHVFLCYEAIDPGHGKNKNDIAMFRDHYHIIAELLLIILLMLACQRPLNMIPVLVMIPYPRPVEMTYIYVSILY